MADLSLEGLASGLPTQDVIEMMTTYDQLKINRLGQQKLDLNKTKDAWRDVNSRISSLESKLSKLTKASTFDSNKTSTTDDEIVTASASTAASAGNYEIVVGQTAMTHRVVSSYIADADKSLNKSGTITINGAEVTIEADHDLDDIRDAINNTKGIGVNASVIGNKLVLESSKTGTDNSIRVLDNDDILADFGIVSNTGTENVLKSFKLDEDTANDDELGYTGSFEITVGGTSTAIDIVETDSLNDIAAKISGVTGIDGTNTNVDANGVLTITGTAKVIVKNTSADGEDNIVKELKLANENEAFVDQRAAQNAQIKTVNGINNNGGVFESQSNSFDEIVEGVTFTIASDAQADDTATIKVERDIDKATSAIKDFVDQYNSVQNFISEKLAYDKDTETAGALQGDGTLMRLQSSLRRNITGIVGSNSDYNQLAMIGIEIDKGAVGEDEINLTGEMSFDASKFKAALKDDPEAVKKLFTADSNNGNRVLRSTSLLDEDISADDALGYSGDFKVVVRDSDGNIVDSEETITVGATDSLNNIKDNLNTYFNTLSEGNVEATVTSSAALEIASDKGYTVSLEYLSGDHIVHDLEIDNKYDSFDGVATRLNNYLDMLIKKGEGVIPNKIDSYEDMMDDIDDRVESLQDRLEEKEESLTKQFTEMEKAISQMNNQMSWMSSQLSSMSSASSLLSMM